MNRNYSQFAAACMILLLLGACTSESTQWDRAVKADTPASYQEFLKRHPTGDRAKLAVVRAAALVEQRQWLLISHAPSVSAINAFLRDNPNSIWAADAKQALDKLSAPQQIEPEPRSVDQQTGDHEAEPVPEPAPAEPSREAKPSVAAAPAKRLVAGVQIGVFKTRASALAAMDMAKTQSVALRASEPQIDVITVKGQSLFRVRAGVSSIDLAKKACQDMTRAGSSCLVFKK
ncbi:MAG: SPOR domain-containing protein [Proteobacteria bacterium]|nr:SPOR domain-containing protein [Pseudomonadota bacterium]